MRFIEFLTEAEPENHIQKRERANRQRARRGIKQRAGTWQQPGDVVPAVGNVGQGFKGARPANRIAGDEQQKPKQAKLNKQKTLAPVDPAMEPFLNLAKSDRQKSVEMNTLLGAMYQAKRTNPQVQLSVPKLVTMSKNRNELQKLFDLGKSKDLGQLAAMSQEIQRSAASPGANAATSSGMSDVPQTPGQTPAGKTMLQTVFNAIKKASKNLSPADWSLVRKKVDNAAQNSKPNPPTGPQQPQVRPVVTQG